MESGEIVELMTEDEGSKNDVPEWVEEAGHELLDVVDTGEYYSLYVKLS
jgi:TusA-related sulfurtransferase